MKACAVRSWWPAGCPPSESFRCRGRPPRLPSPPALSSASGVREPLPLHQYRSRPPPRAPKVVRAPVEPWRDAACATAPRPCGSFPAPRCVAAPKHWPRSSDWSPTTWIETTFAAAGASLGKSFRLSPRLDSRTRHSATGPFASTRLGGCYIADRQSHPANAVEGGSPGRPPRSGSAARTPAAYADTRPRSRVLHVGATGVKCIPQWGFSRTASRSEPVEFGGDWGPARDAS